MKRQLPAIRYKRAGKSSAEGHRPIRLAQSDRSWGFDSTRRKNRFTQKQLQDQKTAFALTKTVVLSTFESGTLSHTMLFPSYRDPTAARTANTA